jgi:hypothetical protein
MDAFATAGTRLHGRPVDRWRPTRPELMARARHYQDLARAHGDEERFWIARALYFGRLSYRGGNSRVPSESMGRV